MDPNDFLSIIDEFVDPGQSLVMRQLKFTLQLLQINRLYQEHVALEGKTFQKYIHANPWRITNWNRMHLESLESRKVLGRSIEMPGRNSSEKTNNTALKNVHTISMTRQEIERLEWIEIHIRKSKLASNLPFDSNFWDTFYFSESYFRRRMKKLTEMQDEVTKRVLEYEHSISIQKPFNNSERDTTDSLDASYTKELIDHITLLQQRYLVSILYWVYLHEKTKATEEEKLEFLKRSFDFASHICFRRTMPWNIDSLFNGQPFVPLLWFYLEKEMYLWFHTLVRCDSFSLPKQCFQSMQYQLDELFTMNNLGQVEESPFYFHSGLTLVYLYSITQNLARRKDTHIINVSSTAISSMYHKNNFLIETIEEESASRVSLQNRDFKKQEEEKDLQPTIIRKHQSNRIMIQLCKYTYSKEIQFIVSDTFQYYNVSLSYIQRYLQRNGIFPFINNILPYAIKIENYIIRNSILGNISQSDSCINDRDQIEPSASPAFDIFLQTCERILSRNFFLSRREIPHVPTLPMPPHPSSIENDAILPAFFPESPSDLDWKQPFDYSTITCSPHAIRIPGTSLKIFEEVAKICKYKQECNNYSRCLRNREIYIYLHRFYSKEAPLSYQLHFRERIVLMLWIAINVTDVELQQFIKTKEAYDEWSLLRVQLQYLLRSEYHFIATESSLTSETVNLDQMQVISNRMHKNPFNYYIERTSSNSFSVQERTQVIQLFTFISNCIQDVMDSLLNIHSKLQLMVIVRDLEDLLNVLKQCRNQLILSEQQTNLIYNAVTKIHNHCETLGICTEFENSRNNLEGSAAPISHQAKTQKLIATNITSNHLQRCSRSCFEIVSQFLSFILKSCVGFGNSRDSTSEFSPPPFEAIEKLHRRLEEFIM